MDLETFQILRQLGRSECGTRSVCNYYRDAANTVPNCEPQMLMCLEKPFVTRNFLLHCPSYVQARLKAWLWLEAHQVKVYESKVRVRVLFNNDDISHIETLTKP